MLLNVSHQLEQCWLQHFPSFLPVCRNIQWYYTLGDVAVIAIVYIFKHNLGINILSIHVNKTMEWMSEDGKPPLD